MTTKSMIHDILIRVVKVLNVCLMTSCFALCWFLYYGHEIVSTYYIKGNVAIILIFFALYVTFARVYDAVSIGQKKISELILSQILAALVCDAFIYVIICLLSKRLPTIWPGVAAIGGQVVVAILWTYISNKWYFAVFPPKKALVVYDSEVGLDKMIEEYGMKRCFEVVNKVHIDYCIEHVEVLDGIQVVFLSGVHSHDRNLLLKYCVEHDITMYLIPKIGDCLISGFKRIHMFHLPMLRGGRYHPNPEFLFFKRFFDIVISGVALVILSPVMLITAICVKAYDGGPVFYKQKRLTKNAREFNILKFRSMRVDAEKIGGAQLSTGEKDPRITPVGRFIRKCRIDELPQLINILGGSMSIVGPRPERPEIAKQYEAVMPEFHLRLQAKAGLTGFAQVYGKYNTTPYNKLQMDLMYISHPSIWEDLSICFATVKILFMRESTEGIQAGQTTAMRDNATESVELKHQMDQVPHENETFT